MKMWFLAIAVAASAGGGSGSASSGGGGGEGVECHYCSRCWCRFNFSIHFRISPTFWRWFHLKFKCTLQLQCFRSQTQVCKTLQLATKWLVRRELFVRQTVSDVLLFIVGINASVCVCMRSKSFCSQYWLQKTNTQVKYVVTIFNKYIEADYS